MKIYNNVIQNGDTIMHFLDQELEKKNSEKLKHRNILWIYGNTFWNEIDKANAHVNMWVSGIGWD